MLKEQLLGRSLWWGRPCPTAPPRLRPSCFWPGEVTRRAEAGRGGGAVGRHLNACSFEAPEGCSED